MEANSDEGKALYVVSMLTRLDIEFFGLAFSRCVYPCFLPGSHRESVTVTEKVLCLCGLAGGGRRVVRYITKTSHGQTYVFG